MPKTALGIRRQYNHAQLPPEIMPWFQLHYPPCSFHGRFQLGYRRAGTQEIWTLFSGERDKLEEFLETMHVSSHLDYYITANAVSGTRRLSDQLFSLHNIVIDVDAHGTDLQPDEERFEELLWCLNRDLFSDSSPPPPTSVIRTGRGIQLWWAIVPMSSKCLTWYREIVDTLVSAIKDTLSEYPELACFNVDGASSGNSVGYFRLPGSINSHTGTDVLILEFREEVYDTHELIKWAKQWKQGRVKGKYTTDSEDFSGRYLTSDIYLLRNFHTTAFFRVRQLIQLRILRDNDVGEETRNNMCFIAYNAMLPAIGPEKAWDKLLLFNEGFKEPMTEKELHQTVDTSKRKGGYRYRNETIIQFLEITLEEQQAIGLFDPTVPFTPLTRLSNHPSRNAARKTIKEDRNRKIREMAAAGLSRAEIADELGISRNTVSTVLGPAQTHKERALAMLSSGKTTREVAEELGITQRSVQAYQKNRERKND